MIKAAEHTYYLSVYTTTTSYYTRSMVASDTTNCPREAQSVYLAVSTDGIHYTVLNNGSGVVFASMGTANERMGSGAIKEPRIFLNKNSYKIIAEDMFNKDHYYEFTSQDGVRFYDQTYQIEVTENSYADVMTLNPTEVHGFPNDPNISLGNTIEIDEAKYRIIVNALGVITNTRLEKVIVSSSEKLPEYITANYSDDSRVTFPVKWNKEELSKVDVNVPGTYYVSGEVIQTRYLNQLMNLNNSTRVEDDPLNTNSLFIDNVDPSTGKVYYDSTKYISGLADPYIYFDKKSCYYYCTGSYFPETSVDGTGVEYDRVVLRRSKTLEGLQSSMNQVTIWKVGNQKWYKGDCDRTGEMGYRNIWAPEIHRVGDYWVIYFTESESAIDAYSIRCHALVLSGERDPYDTALKNEAEGSEWIDYQMQAWPEDSISNYYEDHSEVPFTSPFCLDMTYFEDEANGEAYVVWAGKPSIANGGGSTDLFIAKVNRDRPWELSSSSTRLTWSEYGWEMISYYVNEGPTFVQRDGKVYMCYSASGTGSEYAIGLLTADSGEDLLNRSNWRKNPYPLLTSKDVAGEEGPGHNSFTIDEDGNVIFVYHARPTSHNHTYKGRRLCGSGSDSLSDPCRHARLKRVHWQNDGTPILKMTYEEELSVDHHKVTAVILV